MEGILTPLFCQALTRQELVKVWITPYVRLAGELPRRNKLLRLVSHFFETGLPVVVQLTFSIFQELHINLQKERDLIHEIIKL